MSLSLDELRALITREHMPNDHIIRVVQQALDTNSIRVPRRNPIQRIYAGGTNMCPNSDFAWSHMAATTAGITPATAGDTNYEIYRVYRQAVGANIGANRVRSSGHASYAGNEGANPYIPDWDRVSGVVRLGSDSADNWDVAIQLTNNWIVTSRIWNVRIAVATDDEQPIPSGLTLFAGFWVKRSGGTQGWVDGDDFTLLSKIDGVQGSREFNYKVIARTDLGQTLESLVLNITNIPDTLGPLPGDNKVQIYYPGASGFMEFKLYREDVASGQVDLIAHDRNSDKFVAYDVGQSIRIEPSGLPTVPDGTYRAYEEVGVDALPIATAKTFHDMTIRVPSSFDTSSVTETYLRIGLTGDVLADHDRQILIDTIWAGESYNIWSASPFDDYPSIPSTTMVTAPPVIGGPVDEPPISGVCVWEGHDTLSFDGDWVNLSDVESGLKILSGGANANTIDDFIEGITTQYFRVVFTCGLTILCTATHRFGRSESDRSGIRVSNLKAGDLLAGGLNGKPKMLRIASISICNSRVPLKVRSPRMTIDSHSRLYPTGDSVIGWWVWSHNVKIVD